MCHEALALAFALITLVVSHALLFLVLRSGVKSLRSEMRRVQKGLVDLAGVSARTNIYAQQAIADRARRDTPLSDLLAAGSQKPRTKD